MGMTVWHWSGASNWTRSVLTSNASKMDCEFQWQFGCAGVQSCSLLCAGSAGRIRRSVVICPSAGTQPRPAAGIEFRTTSSSAFYIIQLVELDRKHLKCITFQKENKPWCDWGEWKATQWRGGAPAAARLLDYESLAVQWRMCSAAAACLLFIFHLRYNPKIFFTYSWEATLQVHLGVCLFVCQS